MVKYVIWGGELNKKPQKQGLQNQNRKNKKIAHNYLTHTNFKTQRKITINMLQYIM